MSSHDDGVDANWAAHAAHFGSTDNVIITAASGSATTVTAVVGPEMQTEVSDDEGGKKLRVTRDVLVSSGDVAAIGARATLTISGVAYSIENVPQDCGAFFKVHAVRFGRMDVRRRQFTDEQ